VGVVDEAIEDGVGDGGITEPRRMPPSSIGWYLTLRSRILITPCLVSDLHSLTSVLDAALLTWSSSCPTDVGARSG
jgi:hypothetical protein